MKKTLFTLICLSLSLALFAQKDETTKYNTLKDLSYISNTETDAYRNERCKVDFYYPENLKGFPTIVWFHGGGLEGGSKEIPEDFKQKGVAIVGVNYRLSPRAQSPAYIEDAAEAVAWVFNHIENYGGDPSRIYIAGHSAGGYLTLMVGLDKTYLNKHGIDADRIKALFPVSGQTNTHYTIRKERGLPNDIPLVDSLAPLNQARKLTAPIYLISGDRQLEMTARYEENAHLAAILKSKQSKQVELLEFQGFDHGTVFRPACLYIMEKIKK